MRSSASRAPPVSPPSSLSDGPARVLRLLLQPVPPHGQVRGGRESAAEGPRAHVREQQRRRAAAGLPVRSGRRLEGARGGERVCGRLCDSRGGALLDLRRRPAQPNALSLPLTAAPASQVCARRAQGGCALPRPEGLLHHAAAQRGGQAEQRAGAGHEPGRACAGRPGGRHGRRARAGRHLVPGLVHVARCAVVGFTGGRAGVEGSGRSRITPPCKSAAAHSTPATANTTANTTPLQAAARAASRRCGTPSRMRWASSTARTSARAACCPSSTSLQPRPTPRASAC